MKLSIVATLYRSSPHIEEFHRRATAAARELVDDDYEILLVNDGSPDDSLERAVALAASDPRLVVVDLSRNFGHHKAMMTGLAHAKGERVFLIDSDLEEDPEWLGRFWQQLDAERCDVIYGVQIRRRGGWFERWSGRLFYRLLPLISGVDMPRNMVTARLMSRRYVEALTLHQDREGDIGGLWSLTGFVQRPQNVLKHSTSATTYTLRRRVAMTVNSITSLSNLPLFAVLYVGGAALLVALGLALWALTRAVFHERPLDGWTALIVSVWLLGALIICCIGIVGLYIAKVFAEVRHRPYTIVREIHGRQPD